MKGALDAVFHTEPVSFTAGSPDATLVVMGRIKRTADRESGYHFSLNGSDASALIETLAAYVDDNSGDLADWAAAFLSGIATTLNVELI